MISGDVARRVASSRSCSTGSPCCWSRPCWSSTRRCRRTASPSRSTCSARSSPAAVGAAPARLVPRAGAAVVGRGAAGAVAAASGQHGRRDPDGRAVRAGAQRRPPRSLWMSLAIVPCVVISVIPFASGFSHVTSIVIRNLALCLLAIAAGESLRPKRVSATGWWRPRSRDPAARGRGAAAIAREIHDLVAHAMTAINVQAGVAAHLIERDPRQAYDALRHIKETSGGALTDLRSTLDALRDPSQDAPLGPLASFTRSPSSLAACERQGRRRRRRRGGREVPAAVQRRLSDRSGGADQRRPSCRGRQTRSASGRPGRSRSRSSTTGAPRRCGSTAWRSATACGDARARCRMGGTSRPHPPTPAAGGSCQAPELAAGRNGHGHRLITVSSSTTRRLVRAGFRALLDAGVATSAWSAEPPTARPRGRGARRHRPARRV